MSIILCVTTVEGKLDKRKVNLRELHTATAKVDDEILEGKVVSCLILPVQPKVEPVLVPVMPVAR